MQMIGIMADPGPGAECLLLTPKGSKTAVQITTREAGAGLQAAVIF